VNAAQVVDFSPSKREQKNRTVMRSDTPPQGLGLQQEMPGKASGGWE
jgi:hypothetical protein